jgi:CubicO group peptidase (beta-lactamase class C family)
MVASARSVARFADALLRGDLLAPDSRRQLLRFVPATDYDGYGLGVGKVETSTGEEAWGHFGAGPGFSTFVLHLPKKGFTVAVLSSGEANIGSLGELFAKAALEAGEPRAAGPIGRSDDRRSRFTQPSATGSLRRRYRARLSFGRARANRGHGVARTSARRIAAVVFRCVSPSPKAPGAVSADGPAAVLRSTSPGGGCSPPERAAAAGGAADRVPGA